MACTGGQGGVRGSGPGRWWAACLLACCGLLTLPVPAFAAGLDLRVLVDVSGSMKSNDPGNLRLPALRLLLGLLPEGMDAGVWLFAESVEPLAPPAEVSRQWKSDARRSAVRIHSRGQLTDIGAALEQAAAGWDEGSSGRRAILLLTDGMVDLGPDEAANAAARSRVLEEILPSLKARGVTLFTIALSASADQELLSALADSTDGWFELAPDADRLQRLFLQMFEKSARPDTLPLVENRFLVDGSVREMTVVVFRAVGAPPAELETPAGARISARTAPAGVSWASEAGYDLVTIYNPEAGQWRVVGGEDPDNRVLVVTNLQLQSRPLPNHLLAGEPLEFAARVVQEGEVAAGEEFLRLVTMTLTHYPEQGEPHTWVLQGLQRDPAVTVSDGIFRLPLDGRLTPGRHEFDLVLDGRSFQRQKNQTLVVEADAVALEAHPGDGGTGDVVLRVNPNLLDADKVQPAVTVTDAGGASRTLTLTRSDAATWQGQAADLAAGASYEVVAELKAVTRQGREVTLRSGPVALALPAAPAPAPERPGIDWTLVGGVLLLLNLLGGAAWWFLHRRLRSGQARRIHQLVAGLES